MPPIFKCLICRRDIERSTKSFWNKKGHLLCSTCLDQMDKKTEEEQYWKIMDYLRGGNSFIRDLRIIKIKKKLYKIIILKKHYLI